ncbi:hypothetical protein [Leisingera sp. ANG-S5]|uniref:hypothetical protein n=1 Tax=Leisingera sp. ANG-S5 TaxID=1577901 RepID=UPI000580A1EF|nr:hypothetical protein [Leisingera sp. ANG-S5]KIC32058.1 hypothetical protein RA25_13405 [Leisingera sp. ANG-S5]
MRWILLIGLLAALSGCRDEVRMLTAEELQAFFTHDRKIAFTRLALSGTAVLRTDGTFEVTIPRVGEDTGTWRLDGDRICSRWAEFRRGQELCALAGALPDGTYRGMFAASGTRLGDFWFVY